MTKDTAQSAQSGIWRRVLLTSAAAAAIGLGVGLWSASGQAHHGDWRGDRLGAYEGDLAERHGRRGFRGEGRARVRAARVDNLFNEADMDGDGALSAAELDGARERRFSLMDGDADGSVTADELAEYHIRQRAARWISRRDDDGDGTLSVDELPNRAPRLLRFDLDENGVVTRREIAVAAPWLMRGGDGPRGEGRRGRRGPAERSLDGPAESEAETPDPLDGDGPADAPAIVE